MATTPKISLMLIYRPRPCGVTLVSGEHPPRTGTYTPRAQYLTTPTPTAPQMNVVRLLDWRHLPIQSPTKTGKGLLPDARASGNTSEVDPALEAQGAIDPAEVPEGKA